jgi:hypothetical protein
MVRPWGSPDPNRGGVEQFRGPIERFAEDIVDKCR